VWPKPQAVSSEVAKEVEIIHIQTADEIKAVAIAKTIALIETNHSMDCSRIGLNGEKSCYQFLSSTWKSYSVDILGYVAPQTPENTKKVVEGKILEWKKQGLTDRQIFLMWNQGHPGKCIKGVNSKGVKYDSCSYAEKGIATLSKVIHYD
jgi:hypothetical protein